MDGNKIVVFSGSGLSAPSGIPTFRDNGGLWRQYRFEEVASPDAWERHPEVVLEFYNERRAKAAAAKPNAAHEAIADLERRYEVVVVTQNVDDLHERAGSTRVIHLHGELRKVRSTAEPSLVYDIGGAPIEVGSLCERGSQLRPHIVWFGEQIMSHGEALVEIASAGKLLVVGTSLVVYPAAGLVTYAPDEAEKVIVDPEIPAGCRGFTAVAESAERGVPRVVRRWLAEAAPGAS